MKEKERKLKKIKSRGYHTQHMLQVYFVNLFLE